MAFSFATHSMGLARASSERVLTLRRTSDITSEVRPLELTPRLSEFLGELGFAGYRDLGFDQVLLVEGPTDVVAIQQLLRLYGKDHKAVLLPMGGNTMINGLVTTELQLQELLRISPNISALVDSERKQEGDILPKDRQAFLDLCLRNGVRCQFFIVAPWRTTGVMPRLWPLAAPTSVHYNRSRY